MKPALILAYGLLLGLLIGGAILLLSKPPLGEPVTLQTAPSPTPTHPPRPTSTPEPIMVQISGQVHEPGIYTLPKDTRLMTLIDQAGGVTAMADESRINYTAILWDGDYYYIPAEDEAIPETAANAPGNIHQVREPIYDYPIDLNEADQAALESLPGIGPSRAADILSYRDEHGPFLSLNALANVPGIGPVTVNSLKDYLYVEP